MKIVAKAFGKVMFLVEPQEAKRLLELMRRDGWPESDIAKAVEIIQQAYSGD